MNPIQLKLKDGLLATGLLMIAGSALFFCLPLASPSLGEEAFGLFTLHFLLAGIYFFLLLFKRKSKVAEHRRHYTFLLLILLLISAYALNRELEVFSASPVWLCVLLVTVCTNYMLSLFFHQLSDRVRLAVFFIFGLSLVLFVYLALYVVPLYALSTVALLFFGISIHTFVPLLFTIYTCLLASDLAGGRRRYWAGLGCGITAAVAVVVSYTIIWTANVEAINRSYARSFGSESNGLPGWVQVAQQLDPNAFTEKILQTDLVYVVPDWEGDLFWRMPGRTFGEQQRRHDPLVVMASLFSGSLQLSEEDRINILKSQFRARHQAEEKLWSGKDLRTRNVLTNIRIWPGSHLAYTEKTVTVFNHSTARWQRPEEALYTFHLPEGGVVTALSLWINGQEEKGILTTREKADSAYRTIVGVEVRDPSVVHWQEGSRVTVRVFPVPASGQRVFKIGVTAPLRQEAGSLVYDNIWLEGPDATTARETVALKVEGAARPVLQQAALRADAGQLYTRTGWYRNQWSFALREEGLAPQAFSFNGHRYVLKPYTPKRAPVQFTDLYLDINRAWTKEEFEAIWNSIGNRQAWVYLQNRLVAMNAANREQLFHTLAQQQFSLFPIFLIPQTGGALLVSKSGGPSPNLSDLSHTRFEAALQQHAAEKKKVRLFHLGQQLSPYLSSLREYRSFLFESGDVPALQRLLAAGRFVGAAESENEIVVHSAGIAIAKENGAAASNGPDHLMRLYAYNHILQAMGQGALAGEAAADTLVAEAREAYIVSPVSSLVVLEAQKDYDRFGIEATRNSLDNATLESKGAVPEPHEWVLILLGIAIGFYLFLKTKTGSW